MFYHTHRARSAFKLLEIDDKHHILKPGSVVVECGSSPGLHNYCLFSNVMKIFN